jgi:prepilin-type N-terminal cleavage/methylation domain-containing protein
MKAANSMTTETLFQPADRIDGRRRGFSLVEVLVALTILLFALLALAPLLTGAVRTNASSNQLTNSNALAREKLEELSGYPRNHPRLAITGGANAAVPTGTTTTGPGSIVAENAFCNNDLPRWYQPSTGATSPASTSPGAGWFSYPYIRTYTVEQFAGNLTTRVASPASYAVKLLTVTVRPTQGPFPGLRQTTQSLYVRFHDAT